MSADSYSKCPRCVAMDPFINGQSDSAWTLREYHEFWWYGQTFKVRYSGRCYDCGFEHQFEHQELVSVKDDSQ